MSKPIKWVLLLIPLLVVMVLIARPLLQSRTPSRRDLSASRGNDCHRASCHPAGPDHVQWPRAPYIDRAKATMASATGW